MKKFLIIFIFLMSCKASEQLTYTPQAGRTATGNYTLNWTATNEAILGKNGYYEVQAAADTNSTWAILDTLRPGRGTYSYTLPSLPNYYRLKIAGMINFFMGAIKLTIPDKAIVTNASLKTTTLTWTVTNPVNVSYYLIEKTSDGVNYSQTTKQPDKGPGNYVYRYTRTVRKYKYIITVVFKSGTKSQSVSFK